MITSTRRPILAAALLSLAAWPSAFAHAQNKPNDAQIAHIAYTADNIDIKAGQLALQKSQNPQVKAFAQDMVRDHTAVNEKALALAKKLGVQPQDNDTSRSLTRQAEAETKRLEALNGAAFDKAHAEHELAYHRQVNEAVRGTLIPSASSPGVEGPPEDGAQDLRRPPAACRGACAGAEVTAPPARNPPPGHSARDAFAAALVLSAAALTQDVRAQGRVAQVAMRDVAFAPAQVTVHLGESV